MITPRRLGRPVPLSFMADVTPRVARGLLGKIILVRGAGGPAAGRIVETEAYRGDDAASHSRHGPTPRCSVMFGPPGRVYVYFIYGNHEMLNLVTEPAGFPGAVLIRAVEPVCGASLMRSRRLKAGLLELTNGPGKLCRALGVELSHTGQRLGGPVYSLFDDGYRPARIMVSPRVGIAAAQEVPWRYFIEGNPFVSRCKENGLARPFDSC